jgi:hypothetical protein
MPPPLYISIYIYGLFPSVRLRRQTIYAGQGRVQLMFHILSILKI